MQKLELILDINNLEQSAVKLLEFSGNTKIFLFNAPMGGGKTTFIKAICMVLGVKSNMSSPTYSIVNEYSGSLNKTIYHFDLYRLKNSDECLDIGLEEYIESGNYCFIEWPEHAAPLILINVITIDIHIIDDIRYLRASKI